MNVMIEMMRGAVACGVGPGPVIAFDVSLSISLIDFEAQLSKVTA